MVSPFATKIGDVPTSLTKLRALEVYIQKGLGCLDNSLKIKFILKCLGNVLNNTWNLL